MTGSPVMDSFGTAIGVNTIVSLMKEITIEGIEGEAEEARYRSGEVILWFDHYQVLTRFPQWLTHSPRWCYLQHNQVWSLSSQSFLLIPSSCVHFSSSHPSYLFVLFLFLCNTMTNPSWQDTCRDPVCSFYLLKVCSYHTHLTQFSSTALTCCFFFFFSFLFLFLFSFTSSLFCSSCFAHILNRSVTLGDVQVS